MKRRAYKLDYMPYAQDFNGYRQEPACPGGQIYIIQSGDTLYLLAQRFQVSVSEILNANPGLNPNAMYVGQHICIPARPVLSCPNGTIYVIKPGDNLYAIAARYNVTLDEILRANPQLTNPAQLTVGTNICIPAPTPGPARFGCTILRSATPSAAQGVVLLNYSSNTLLVAANNLPALQTGLRYVVFAKRRDGSGYLRVDLLGCAPSTWVGSGGEGRPLQQYDRITLSTESGPGNATPTGTIILEGNLANACTG